VSRPPYNVNIPGTMVNKTPSSSTTVPVSDAIHSEETSVGTDRRKPTGFIPPTSYDFFYKNYSRAQGTWSYRNDVTLVMDSVCTGVIGGSKWNSLNHFNEILLESDIYDPSLANRSLIKARNALKGTNINLGVAFAERNRTARLVGDTAINLAKSYSLLRHGEIRRAMRQLGILPSAKEPRGSSAPKKWLELQYGWKPLLSDVYGACEALSERTKEDWRVTARGTAKSELYREEAFAQPRDVGRGVARVMRLAYTRIDALPQNEAIISLASLGVSNPAVILWEVVPFSFVVDWFLPVGSWLESLDALLGYGSAYTSTSQFTRAEWVGTSTGPYKQPSPKATISGSYTETKRIVKLSRAASSGVPIPRFPSIKDPRSLGHMANGLALLTQVFGGRR